MVDINKLNNNSIILCPTNLNSLLIKEINKTDLNIKLVTKSELIKNLEFDIDDKALLYLKREYNFTFKKCEDILNNLYFIKDVGNQKIKDSLKYLDELKENNLLEFNEYYKYLLVGKKIYVIGYSKLDRELKLLLDRHNLEYEYIDEINENIIHQLHSFKTVEEEISYTCEKIIDLIKNGVNPSRIKILNYEDDSVNRRILSYYNIKLDEQDDLKLKNHPDFNKFINYFNELSLVEAYQKVIEEVDDENFISSLKKLVIKVNDLGSLNKDDQKEYIDYYSDSIMIKSIHYNEAIENIGVDYLEDDYIFINNFNASRFPRVHKDIDYYFDVEKEALGLNTSTIKNEIEKEKLINFLNSHHHLFITIHEEEKGEPNPSSLLVNSLNYQVIKDNKLNKSYSRKYIETLVAIDNDLYHNFRMKEPFYNVLDIKYRSYDNSFNLNSSIYHLDNLRLSYSTVTDFYECPFKYYMKYILRIDPFDTTFYTKLGNAGHKMLEDYVQKEVDYRDYLYTFNESYMECYFANRLVKLFMDVIEKKKEFVNITSANKLLAESEIIMKLNDKLELKGQIDCIHRDEKDLFYALIDYKSNADANIFKPELLQYGLKMQLPIYGLLTKYKYPEYRPIGFYIQSILAKDEKSNYLMNGVTLKDEDLMRKFDSTIFTGKSSFISGLGVDKEGKLKESAFLVTKEDFDNYIDDAKKRLIEAGDKIYKAEFNVQPTFIKAGSKYLVDPCKYCSYKDVCYMTNKNKKEIKL